MIFSALWIFRSFTNSVLLRKAKNHRAEFSKGRIQKAEISKVLKAYKMEKLENKTEKLVRVILRTRRTYLGPPALIFRPYFLI